MPNHLHRFYFDTEDDSRRAFELPGATPHYNPDRPGRVKHILLELAIDFDNRSFSGTCTTVLVPVRAGIDTLVLDAEDLQIDAVRIGSIAQPFHYDGKQLRVRLAQPTGTEAIELSVDYCVEQPQRGLYFVGPTDRYPDKPTQAWTQGEDEDSRFWFPCFDYPGQLASSELRVRVAKPYTAISNGTLTDTTDLGNERIFHWFQAQVHPTYLMTLAAGEFVETRDEWDGIPITYHVAPDRAEQAARTLGKTPRMVAFFSEKYGYRYAFPKYAQVCVDDFIFGGMENTSCTLLTDRCLLDERAEIDNMRSESLVAHELAHQWFGDLVVIKHWSHAWIKEGMASYAEVQWTEHEYGNDDAAYYLLGEARSYLDEDSTRYRRPIVTNVYREAIELYDRHLYEKGACVYHMIRAALGDAEFDRAIHAFVRDNAHKTVETIDLLRAIDNATGRNLAPLFDQYVFRGGHPDFKVAYSWDAASNLAQLTVTQSQAKTDKDGTKREIFDLRIPVAFGYVETGSEPTYKTVTLRVNEPEHSFYFPLDRQPQYVSFDAGNAHLKTVELAYPARELKAQLQHDRDVIARIYAAEALGKQGNLDAVKALGKALQTDPFWGVRVEVAKQLGKVELDRAAAELIAGLDDADARVRRAVLDALGKLKTEKSFEAIARIAKAGDPSYYTEATALRALGGMVTGTLKARAPEVLELLKDVLRSRAGWNEVVRAGAIGGLSKLKTTPEAADAILEYVQIGIPQALRLAAIRALGAVAAGQEPDRVERILEQLDAIAGESFFLTQVAVVGALSHMQTPKAIAILSGLAERTPDGRVRRRAEEAIVSVRRKLGTDKVVKELREELDALKQDNLDLRSRLAKLEAQSGSESDRAV
ncbi:aminopeptidase N [Rubidibacter lacunae KORDI 51-2]|uniref:Aminopeptidase N n=1 Tax=Rubidibacter lacunae KORDI 51-2 TaxID=582515 RepID=U5DK31_9CHRO|nr:M1 family metallopeptidase [Rubidibacter lacunae]ERN40040.1 aminopeptidase N [Rubidibacter lacunae KORDI 51-2]